MKFSGTSIQRRKETPFVKKHSLCSVTSVLYILLVFQKRTHHHVLLLMTSRGICSARLLLTSTWLRVTSRTYMNLWMILTIGWPQRDLSDSSHQSESQRSNWGHPGWLNKAPDTTSSFWFTSGTVANYFLNFLVGPKSASLLNSFARVVTVRRCFRVRETPACPRGDTESGWTVTNRCTCRTRLNSTPARNGLQPAISQTVVCWELASYPDGRKIRLQACCV